MARRRSPRRAVNFVRFRHETAPEGVSRGVAAPMRRASGTGSAAPGAAGARRLPPRRRRSDTGGGSGGTAAPCCDPSPFLLASGGHEGVAELTEQIQGLLSGQLQQAAEGSTLRVDLRQTVQFAAAVDAGDPVDRDPLPAAQAGFDLQAGGGVDLGASARSSPSLPWSSRVGSLGISGRNPGPTRILDARTGTPRGCRPGPDARRSSRPAVRPGRGAAGVPAPRAGAGGP